VNSEIKKLKESVKNLKVLYSEDEEEMRIGTELFLKKFFTSVDTAVDGEDGLNHFKENRYDIVFTDIMMPKLDGIEMLNSIRKIDSNIFAVTLTASEVREEAIVQASDLYFRKPVRYEDMIEIMKAITKKFNL